MDDKLLLLYKRIATDFEFFCKQLKIAAKDFKVSPDKTEIKLIPFVLAHHQKELIEYIESPQQEKTIIKCRQIGVSTLLYTYCLWQILYKNNQNILYLIDSDEKANTFRYTIQNIYESIPEIIKPKGLRFSGKNIVHDALNSKIALRTATHKMGRSEAYTITICDEYSYVDEKIQEAVDSALIASSTNRIFLSTPRTEGDLFAKKVEIAQVERTLFRRTIWDVAEDWFGTLDNAQLWFDESTKGKSQAAINREYLCELRGASDSLIWELDDTMFVPAKNRANERVIVSMDLGFKPDPTAILYAVQRNNNLYVYAEEICEQYTIPQVAGLLKKRDINIKYLVMDSSGKQTDQTSGVSSYSVMRRLLSRKIYTRKLPDRIEMQRRTNTAMLSGKVFINPSCSKLLEALHNFEWENAKIPSKSKYKHIHDALVYLVHNWLLIPRNNTKPTYSGVPIWLTTG